MVDDEDLRHVQRRALGLNPRCTCKSADTLAPSSPPMFHPEHIGRVCGVRLPDGETCQCYSVAFGVDTTDGVQSR